MCTQTTPADAPAAAAGGADRAGSPARSFAFFHGNCTWNSGRNRLLRLAAACPTAGPRAPLYYVLLDCDAALRQVRRYAAAGADGGGGGGGTGVHGPSGDGNGGGGCGGGGGGGGGLEESKVAGRNGSAGSMDRDRKGGGGGGDDDDNDGGAWRAFERYLDLYEPAVRRRRRRRSAAPARF